MNRPRPYTPRRQALRHFRRRLILETQDFLNHELAQGSPRPSPDSFTPEQVRCARQTPEPMFLVWVWPWWPAAELVDLPDPEYEALNQPRPTTAAQVTAGGPDRAAGDPTPADGAPVAGGNLLPAAGVGRLELAPCGT